MTLFLLVLGATNLQVGAVSSIEERAQAIASYNSNERRRSYFLMHEYSASSFTRAKFLDI